MGTDKMRGAVLLVAGIFLFGGLLWQPAYSEESPKPAATLGIDGRHKCPNGIKTFKKDEVPSKTFDGQKGGDVKKELEAFQADKQNCHSACFDEKSKIEPAGEGSSAFTVSYTIENKCKRASNWEDATQLQATKEGRGCAKSQQQPMIEGIDQKTKEPKNDSRCLYLTTGEEKNADGTNMESGQTLSESPIVVTGDTGRDAMAKLLTDGGIEPEKAAQIAAGAPDDDVKKILDADGDVTKTKDALNHAISENSTFSDEERAKLQSQIGSMDLKPEGINKTIADVTVPNEKADTTFNGGENPASPERPSQVPDYMQKDTDKLGRYEIIKRVMTDACNAQQPPCDPNQFSSAMIGVHTVECDVNLHPDCTSDRKYAGFFQLGKDEYAKYLPVGMEYIKQTDPALYAQAQANMNNSANPRLDPLLNTIAAAGLHGQYASPIQSVTSDPLQQSAMGMMVQLMPSQTRSALFSDDPNNIFSMQLNSGSRWALGNNYVPYASTGADAVNGILSGPLGRKIQQGVNIAQTGEPGSVYRYAGAASPFSSFTDNGQYAVGFDTRSPFANTSLFAPVSIGRAVDVSGGNRGYISPYGNGSGVYNANYGGYSGGYNSGNSVSPLQYITQPVQQQPQILPQPVLSMVTSQTTAARGSTITLSWSTANVSTASPCRIVEQTQQNSTLIAQSNGGSRQITIDPSLSSGTLTFSMQCTTLDGFTISRSVPVVVQ